MAGIEAFNNLKLHQEYKTGTERYFLELPEGKCSPFNTVGTQNIVIKPSQNNETTLFVGNLDWDITPDELLTYFGKYGEVKNVKLKTDPLTGRSRGFAFVVFKVAEAVDAVLAVGEHFIKNRLVDTGKAVGKHGKVFVGVLSDEITDRDIMSYFSKYGKVLELETPYDPVRQQRMGFCFVTFDTEQPVWDLMKKPKHIINGKRVCVKRYIRWAKGRRSGTDGGASGCQEIESRKSERESLITGRYRGTGKI